MADFGKSRGFGGGASRGGFGSRGGSFNNNRGGFGGKPSFNKFGGGRSSGGRTEMFNAVCSKCGNDCQVPFRPNGEKPVFCSPCFDKTSGRNAEPKRDSYEQNSYGRRDGYAAPQRSYGQDAERTPRPANDTRIDNLVTQIQKLHEKIDKLLFSLID